MDPAARIAELELSRANLLTQLAAVQRQYHAHERKWRDYEEQFILPCFTWAEEVGFDLRKAVSDNPGKNCVVLFVERLRQMLAEAERDHGFSVRVQEAIKRYAEGDKDAFAGRKVPWVDELLAWRDKFNEVTAKVAKCHDILDAAKVTNADGTHPQLLPRLQMLVAERDRLRTENEKLLARDKEWWRAATVLLSAPGEDSEEARLGWSALSALKLGSAWSDVPEPVQKIMCDQRDAALARCAELKEQCDKLFAAIQKHYAQKADDRCWLDDVELYKAAGLPTGDYDKVGSPSEMLKNCERFVTLRCSGGGPWKSYAELEAENERLKQMVLERYGANVVAHWRDKMATEMHRRGWVDAAAFVREVSTNLDESQREADRLLAENSALRAALKEALDYVAPSVTDALKEYSGSESAERANDAVRAVRHRLAALLGTPPG